MKNRACNAASMPPGSVRPRVCVSRARHVLGGAGAAVLLAGAGLAVAVPAMARADVVAIAPGQADPQRLYLRTGEVDTGGGMAGLPPLAGQVGAAGAGKRFVVQLDGPMTPRRRERMVAAGMGIGPYLPLNAYIVTLDRADGGMVGGLEFVRWYSEYLPAWKIDPDLSAPAVGAGDAMQESTLVGPVRRAAAPDRRYSIVLFPDADPNAAMQAVWNVQGMVVTGWEEMGTHIELLAQGPAGAVPALAQIDDVQFIERAPEITERRNDRAKWIVQSNIAGVTPLHDAGLRGEGQIVGIMDTKIRLDHCSFADSNPVGPTHRKILAYNTSPGQASHGTHVAGTVAGDAGSASGNTRGIAYEAKIVYHEWPSFTESAMFQRLTLHDGQGARVHTNSWGDDGTTAYNGLCRGIDAFQWANEESLVLFAVTNGSQLKNPENAKNLLAVGASGSEGSQQNHCTAGAGPTADGRRKPEIFAPGCGTISANSSTTCGTTQMTGTSMACPAVAGAALLVRQYYTDGFYPLGIASPATAMTPSAALIKATLLNSAADMTGVPGYPSNGEGWGRVLADDALYFEGDSRKLQVKDVRNAEGLSTGQFVEYQLPVIGTGEALRITMAYTEPPATANASFAAVNDLDLEVVSPLGQTYLGNVFSGGYSSTGGSRDDRNNVEQVHVQSPTPGVWTVRVRGAAVNQDTQGYALVMTGDVSPAEPPALLMSMVSAPPSLMAPGEAHPVEVRIIEGTQTLVPGSAKLHYRAGAGPYQEVALALVSGQIYSASLPAFACGDEPEFYLSAMASDNSVITLPSTAPQAVLAAQVGELVVQEVFAQDFGASLPAGWSMTGLWNLAGGCAPPGASCHAGPWAYYGNTSTCTYQTGSSGNEGALTSPLIQLPAVPPGGELVLQFCYALVTENNSNFDIATVRLNGQELGRMAESEEWRSEELNLAQHGGQAATLEWHFETGDGYLNDKRGWHMDGVRVVATVVACNEPSCYANCDGSTAQPLLNVDDFTCFINEFAAAQGLSVEEQRMHYANCDGSTAAPVLNVDDFTCFMNEFAQGCR